MGLCASLDSPLSLTGFICDSFGANQDSRHLSPEGGVVVVLRLTLNYIEVEAQRIQLPSTPRAPRLEVLVLGPDSVS